MKMEEDVDVEADTRRNAAEPSRRVCELRTAPEGRDSGLDAGGSPSDEALLESDVILPAQYFDMCRQTAHVDTGIHRLMLTLLEDGIRCWQEGIDSFSRRKSRLAFHDNEWIFGDVQDGPFAFETICEALGIDPEWLREGLHRWREAGGARIPRRSPCMHLTRMPLMPARRRCRRVR
jgi:hypothetical protein